MPPSALLSYSCSSSLGCASAQAKSYNPLWPSRACRKLTFRQPNPQAVPPARSQRKTLLDFTPTKVLPPPHTRLPFPVSPLLPASPPLLPVSPHCRPSKRPATAGAVLVPVPVLLGGRYPPRHVARLAADASFMGPLLASLEGVDPGSAGVAAVVTALQGRDVEVGGAGVGAVLL